MLKMRNLFLPGLIVAALAFTALATDASAGDHKVAPGLKTKTLDGKTFDLAKYRGKVVVINFWATWCPPCVKEIPDFIELQKKYKKDGLVFAGVSVDQKPDPVKDFVKTNKVNYLMMMSNDKIWDRFQKLVSEKKRNSVPVTFIVDRKGKIRGKHVGAVDRKTLEKELLPLLKEKAPTESATSGI